MDSTTVADPGADRYFENDLKELASEDPYVREQACVRVAQRGIGIVQALMSILHDFNKPGLAGVARSLGQIGDRRAIPVLVQAAKMGDDDLRLEAVWALAQFHEPEVLPILLSEAERPHAVIQGFLASVLGTFQDDRVMPVLSKLVLHTSREVAFQAACAIGELGNPAGIKPLQKACRRHDPLVRAASAASLRRLGGRAMSISIAQWVIGILLLGALGAGIGWVFYK